MCSWSKLLLPMALLLVACQAKLTVPPTAQLECQSTADCPPNTFCNASNLCEPTDSSHTILPAFTSVAITPDVGKAGATFTITLDTNKPLKSAPTLELDLVPPPTTEPVCTTAGATTYQCTYVAEGTENNKLGGTVTFQATITDLDGNTVKVSDAGSIELDFTPPSLINPSVAPAIAGHGATITVSFTASKPLSNPDGGITVVATPALAETPLIAENVPGTLNYELTYSLHDSPDGGLVDPNGKVAFSVVLTDVAGNVTNPALMLGSTMIDQTVPVLSNVQTLEGTQPASRFSTVSPYNQVTLSFESSKALTAYDATFGLCPSSGSEQPAPCAFTGCTSQSEQSSFTYTCTYQATGNELTADGMPITMLPDATLPVAINGVDEAGNQASAEISITLDFSPPILVAASASVPIAGVGTVESLIFTVNEALSSDPTVSVTGPNGPLMFTKKVGTDYAFAYTIAAGDGNGPCKSQITMTDLVGNTTMPALTGPSFALDTLNPGVSGVATFSGVTTNATVYSEVDGFNVVTLTFDTTKPIEPKGVLTVTLSGYPMKCGTYQGGTPNYTCTYDIVYGSAPDAGVRDDVPGPQAIIIAAVDEAGNTSSADTSVTFDFTPLTLEGSIAPSPVTVGTTPVYSISASKPLTTGPMTPVVTPVGTANGTLGMPSGAGAGVYWSFSYPAAAPPLQGTFSISTEATDSVGHKGTASPVTFMADGIPPSVLGLTVISPKTEVGGVIFSEVTGFNVVTVTFNTLKSLDTAGDSVTATLDGKAMSCRNYQTTAPNYVCGYIVSAANDTSGVKTVTINTIDEVDQTASASTSVTFDISPLILQGTVAPNPAKLGAIPVLTLTANKPVPSVAANEPAITSVTVKATGLPSTALGTPTLAGAGTFWTYTFPPANSSVNAEFNIVTQATDIVGHVGEATTILAFVDTIGPVLSNVATNATQYSAVSGYNSVVLTFNSSKSVDPDAGPGDAGPGDGGSGDGGAGDGGSSSSLKVTMGTPAVDGGVTSGLYPLNCSAFQTTSPSYTCKYAVLGSEMFGNTPISKLPDAVMPIIITAIDEAGNVATAGTSVTLDFVPPVLTGTPALVYQPGPSNPLYSVSAATTQTGVQVSFPMNEPLGANPGVALAGSAASGFDLSLKSASGTAYVYGQTIETAGIPPDGTYQLALSVVDVVGNATTITTSSNPPLVVDTTPPASPGTTTSGLVTYTRVPWGQSSTSGVPTFTMTGNAGAAPGAVDALAFDGPNAATADTIGTATVTTSGASAGSFAMTLSRADRVQVYVAGVDEAGNVSTPAQVHNVTWTASFDETEPNPNLLVTATDFLITGVGSLELGLLAQDPTQSQISNGNESIEFIGDSQADTDSASPTVWLSRQLTNVTTPPARDLQGTAYDSARGRTVMFGGILGTTSQAGSDTWEWNGTQWTTVTPPTSPSARYYMGMIYDAAFGQTVLFGGETTAGPVNDTWIWNGTTWTNVSPANSPAAREGMSMSYDTTCGCVFMFGGISSNFENDMWMWNGATWTNVTPSGTSPSPRFNPAMAFDVAEGATVLFGGSSATGDLNDTWTWIWNTTTNSGAWTSLAVSTPPSIRDTAGLAYDSQHGVLVLFGGYFPVIDSPFTPAGTYNDTWTWNGTSWTKVLPATSPGSRDAAGFAYDSLHDRVVMFGGQQVVSNTVGAPTQDTWVWNGTTWAEVTPSTTAPAARVGQATAFDSGAGKTVLFGGCTAADCGGSVVADTWLWNGVVWQQQSPTTSPGARSGHGMAYDITHAQTVLFGGVTSSAAYLDDTWTWNGTTWANPSGPNPTGAPPARVGPAMAYDAANKVTVMFGGGTTATSFADTWLWNGSTWTQKTPSPAPSARQYASMAYDSARGRIVLFGGNALVNSSGFPLEDTWEWNTATGTWTNITQTGPSTPLPEYGGAMAYDSTRGLSVLFGGTGEGTTNQGTNSVYGWDGTVWEQLTPAATAIQPLPRFVASMTYDSNRQRLVVVDGTTGPEGAVFGETWEIPSDATETTIDNSRRPAEILQISFGAADETAPTITSMTFDTYVGAEGNALTTPGAGAVVAGATVAAWDAWSAAWKPLTTSTAGPSSFPELKYTTASASEAERYLMTGAQTINFAVYPTRGQGNGANPPEVALDYAALTVQYTH